MTIANHGTTNMSGRAQIGEEEEGRNGEKKERGQRKHTDRERKEKLTYVIIEYINVCFSELLNYSQVIPSAASTIATTATKAKKAKRKKSKRNSNNSSNKKDTSQQQQKKKTAVTYKCLLLQ